MTLDMMRERMDMLEASIEEVSPEYDLGGNPFLDTDGGLGVRTYRVYGPGVDERLAEYGRINGRTTYLHHDARALSTIETSEEAP